MNAPPTDRVFWTAVVLIVFIALAFRLPGLASRSLWIDELYSQWFASRSLTELWRVVPYYEPHPPFYYTVLKGWTFLLGDSELGLRSLSLATSLATVATGAISGRFLGGGRLAIFTGLLGSVLLAVNFANIRDAQNARPYALQTFFCTLAIIAALSLVFRLSGTRQRSERIGGGLRPAVVLGVSAGLSLWIHNTGLFIAFGIWCGLFLSLISAPAGTRLRNSAVFIAAGILALVVWAPYLPIFLDQSRAFMGLGFWLQPRMRDLYSAWMLIFGSNIPALLLGLALLALGIFRLAHCSPALFSTATAILLVPLAVVLAVSFAVKPIYIQRLFAWMVPLAMMVIALGVLTSVRQKVAQGVISLALVAVGAVASFNDFGRPIDDWKAIAAEIAQNQHPGDVVIATPAEGSIALGYYARRHGHFPPIVCVPGCYPQRGLERDYGSNLGAPKIVEADRKIVEQALKTGRRVWLVQVSVQLYDPRNIVRSTIEANRTFVRYYGNSLARVDLFE